MSDNNRYNNSRGRGRGSHHHHRGSNRDDDAGPRSRRYNDQQVADDKDTKRMNHRGNDEKYDEDEESGGVGGDEMDQQKAQREAERRARMARLRAENEQEERKLAPLEQKDGNDSDGDDNDSAGNRKRKQRDITTRPQEQVVQVNDDELQGLDEDEQMQMLLGIQGFGSTKGRKVDSNHNSCAAGAAAKNKARKYRQYMNRKNGFNRPLDKMD